MISHFWNICNKACPALEVDKVLLHKKGHLSVSADVCYAAKGFSLSPKGSSEQIIGFLRALYYKISRESIYLFLWLQLAIQIRLFVPLGFLLLLFSAVFLFFLGERRRI